MSEYKPVKGSREISMHIADVLEQADPQTYNGMNRAQTIRAVNDILQGRGEPAIDDLLAGLEAIDSRKVPAIRESVRSFQAQKDLMKQPYRGHSSKNYRFGVYDRDPENPLKIINQRLFDRAAKDGFPPDFFRKSFFDGVTLYCMPDGADLKFSMFQDCTFAVCRIHGACFDGTSLHHCEFHDCDLFSSTFFASAISNTHFYDSSLSLVSFQRARLARCNTIDCKMDRVSFLNATLDGCFYGRVTPSQIRYLHTAVITQGGATEEECRVNRAAIYKALAVSDLPPKQQRRTGPER